MKKGNHNDNNNNNNDKTITKMLKNEKHIITNRSKNTFRLMESMLFGPQSTCKVAPAAGLF